VPSIRCTVDNCHYWHQGNTCNASEILVTSDSFGQTAADSVDAPQAANLNTTPVNTCLDTCCKTFVTKGSGQIRADGVTRNPL